MSKKGFSRRRNPKLLFICIKRQTLLFMCMLLLLVSYGLYNSYAIIAARNQDLSARTVVIDPGHGGIDGGTHDQMGLLEKDLNLEVALLLKSCLESKKIKVVMTRSSDISLENYSSLNSSRYRKDLDARKQIINHSAADVFVSLHVNARPRVPASRGVKIFYHPQSEAGKRLADSISQGINRLVYEDLLQTDAIRAESLPENFFILREASVPGSLVEIGFITNPEDKKLLQDASYKQQIALAISKGICDYLQNVRSILSYYRIFLSR